MSIVAKEQRFVDEGWGKRVFTNTKSRHSRIELRSSDKKSEVFFIFDVINKEKKNWGGALNYLILKINCVKLKVIRSFFGKIGGNQPPNMGETMAKKKAKKATKAKRKTTKKAKKSTRKKSKRR